MTFDISKLNSFLFNSRVFNVGDKRSRNVIVNTDHGTMIVNRYDSNPNYVGHGAWMLDHGNCSTIEALCCYDFLNGTPNPVILDIGANIGTFTTWMAKAFPNGEIHSFEPQMAVFQLLCGNIAVNNLYNVRTYNFALGKQQEKLEVFEPNYFINDDFGTFSLLDKVVTNVTEKKLIVQVNTVDWFVDFYKLPKVDLLKIDVEGMDVDVLRGSINTIAEQQPGIFIEHYDSRKSVLEEIKNFLDPFDYTYQMFNSNVLCKKK